MGSELNGLDFVDFYKCDQYAGLSDYQTLGGWGVSEWENAAVSSVVLVA